MHSDDMGSNTRDQGQEGERSEGESRPRRVHQGMLEIIYVLENDRDICSPRLGLSEKREAGYITESMPRYYK